jgi:hypothetical protein
MSKLTTTQSNAVNAYREFLKAGTTYGEAMQAAAKSLGGTPCPTLLAALAAVHAERYKCNFTWNASGSAVFYTGAESTRETRNDSARKSWERNVMVWFKPEREAKPVKHNRVSREARDAGKAFLDMFDSVEAAVKALRSIAK